MLRGDEAGWSNPKILTIFLVIFLCGVGFGAVGTSAFLHSRIPHQPSVSDRFNDLSKQLHLTSDQQRVVMQVLDDYAKYYENLEEDRQNVAEHGKRQILLVLRPDQQKRFLEIYRSLALPDSHNPND